MQTLKKLPTVVMTLAAVLALGFGASEAFAENAATACRVNPPAELGECYGDQHCDLMCQQQPGYTEGSIGVCQFDGCCSCFL